MNESNPQQPPAGPDDADAHAGDAHAADEQALDELLAGARWAEPSAASAERLKEAWRRLSADERPPHAFRRWGGAYRVAAGVAAAVVVSLGLWSVWKGGAKPQKSPLVHGAVQPSVVPSTSPSMTAPADRSRESAPEHPRPREDALVLWRPPTPWEMAMISSRPRPAATRRSTRPASRPARSRPNSLIARVDSAVDRLASGDATDPAAVAAELLKDFPADRVEQRLTPAVFRSTSGRRAAVRLLAHVATSRSAPLLASLTGDPAVRGDAIAGLLRVGDVPTLAAVAGSSGNEAERRRLIAAMLRREPRQAVQVYLAFLSDEATAATALAALDDVRNPPVDALFARLNDPRRVNRLAAARALGRIDGPAVTARLAAMVRLNVNRHEALVALATSDGPEAKSFFERALASKELGASARTARAGLNHL